MTNDGTLTPDQVAGKYLRELRIAAKLTQAKVADAAGIDRSLYNALENGRREITMVNAVRIAPVLNVGNPELLLPPAVIRDQEEAGKTLHDRLEAIAAGVARTVENQEEGLRLLRGLRSGSPGKAAQSGKSPARGGSRRKGA